MKDRCGAGHCRAGNCASALQALYGQLMLEATAGSGDVRTIPSVHSQHKFTPKENGEVLNFVVEEPKEAEHRES